MDGITRDDLSLTVMTGNSFPICENPELKLNSFKHWFEFWLKIYRDQGSTFSPSPADFYRQDFIIIMTLKSRPLEPIGLSLSSIYNLDCAVNQQHHYASFYTSQFIEKLKERGSSTVMSSEYLSLCPEFRTRIEGLSAASILIEGTILNMVACGHHRMICTARADNSTSYLAQIAGYEIFQSDLEKRAFRCDLMHVDAKQRSSVDSVKQQRVKELANSIWERVTICHDAKLRMEFLREHSPASSVSSKAA